MVLVALYVAVGSGLPSVRAYFELSDLQFFNAWPLKLLMALLVLTLATVTWERIPFTPPRYGVWCIHSGIIVLIAGMAMYYAYKIEGQTTVRLGQTVDHFYDTTDRSLYVRLNGVNVGQHILYSLPRFHEYAAELGNAGVLDRKDLRNIVPTLTLRDPETNQLRQRTLTEEFQLSGPLKLDVIGYWPYAHIESRYVEDPKADAVGIHIDLTSPHTGQAAEEWLVASDPQNASKSIPGLELEHRDIDDASQITQMEQSAATVHQLDVKIGDFSEKLTVEPGKRYPLGKTGYTLAIEDFNPAFPAMNGQMVQVLTMMVTTPTQTFRRQLIPGRAVTDWKLGVKGAGPMGKRQTKPLDEALQTTYRFEDPNHLLPDQEAEKHTLITTSNQQIIDIHTGLKRPAEVKTVPASGGDIELVIQDTPWKMHFERRGHVRRLERVVPTPLVQRERSASQSGTAQVLQVRVTVGDWTKTVYVPFADQPYETIWNGPILPLPGGKARLELQLGNRRRQLPARITLKSFELVHYPGGTGTKGPFRDFKSTIVVEDPSGAYAPYTAVAHMNNPVHFANGRWAFFQAAWDPQGQQWTVLGVGSRPGVWVMVTGCIMMAVGLLYAFYLKPVIIRRMKQKALAQAQARALANAAKADQEPFSQLASELAGSAKAGVSTEPIMEMTRGED
jgi:hypothetical protein